MKKILCIYLFTILVILSISTTNQYANNKNPLLKKLNQPILFSLITAPHIKSGTEEVLKNADKIKEDILAVKQPTFENTLQKLDDL